MLLLLIIVKHKVSNVSLKLNSAHSDSLDVIMQQYASSCLLLISQAIISDHNMSIVKQSKINATYLCSVKYSKFISLAIDPKLILVGSFWLNGFNYKLGSLSGCPCICTLNEGR